MTGTTLPGFERAERSFAAVRDLNARLSTPEKRVFHRWSGWANAIRTAVLDPEVCSVEQVFAFKEVSQVVAANQPP